VVTGAAILTHALLVTPGAIVAYRAGFAAGGPDPAGRAHAHAVEPVTGAAAVAGALVEAVRTVEVLQAGVVSTGPRPPVGARAAGFPVADGAVLAVAGEPAVIAPGVCWALRPTVGSREARDARTHARDVGARAAIQTRSAHLPTVHSPRT